VLTRAQYSVLFHERYYTSIFDETAAWVRFYYAAQDGRRWLALLIGVDRFAEDIESMIGFRPGIYWRICWKFIAPCFLLVRAV